MTGNIQKMAEAVWNAWVKRKDGGLKPAEQRAALLLFCTWFMYVVGGVCGAALAAITSFHWSLTPAAGIYALGMLSMQIEPPKKPKPAPSDASRAPTVAVSTVAGEQSAPSRVAPTSSVSVEVK